MKPAPQTETLPAAAAWLVALVLLAAPGAQAHDEAAQRIQLEQKLRLVATLIADSPAATRIAASGDAAAGAHLDEGRVHHALARDLLERDDLAGARRAIDEALRHLAMARRLVPDAPARQAAARRRHEQMLASTERLIDAWRARIDSGRDDGRDLTAALGLLADARDLGRAAQLDEANRKLELAERHVLAGMRRLLQDGTLDYTPRFAGPGDQFQYELTRHASLAELVPLAIHELQPGAEALALIERYGEAAKALRTQAITQMQSGEPEQALGHIRNASMYLERALAAAGLATPPPTGSLP